MPGVTMRKSSPTSLRMMPISLGEEDIDSKGWFDVFGEVDIGEVGSGIYELRVSVKDARANKTVQRTAVFSVE